MSTEMMLVNSAGISSLAAVWLFAFSSGSKWQERFLRATGVMTLVFCFLCLSLSLLVRAVDAARFPVANLYESLLLFAWGLLLASFLLFSRLSIPLIGCFASLCVSLVFLYASWLPPELRAIKPLMPALTSYWRAVHVPPLIVSYAFFVISGVLSILYLWCARRRFTALSCLSALSMCLFSIYLATQKIVAAQTIQLFFWPGLCISCLACFAFFVREAKRPLAGAAACEMIDTVSQKAIAIAFPLLTFGIITGALWANHAWGAYWTWDPKESMSLATWLSYACYLHLRTRHTCRTDSLALCAFFGLLLTVLTYLGFTFLSFGGLHTYGAIG